jgi:hypothetical protein
MRAGMEKACDSEAETKGLLKAAITYWSFDQKLFG